MIRHLIIAFALTFLAGCGFNPPIYNVSNTGIPGRVDGSTMSMLEIRQAILAAASRKGWSPRVSGEGAINAFLQSKGRRANIVIVYSPASYDITLIDSEGLDQKKGKIDPHYNKWVRSLDQRIQAELGKQARSGA